MRKQTKLVAVLSAAALLAMGASMTSFAAGWQKDDAGVWHYYDSDDEMVTGEWKKDGGKWFYLDDDGDMAVDQWVDDDYYVGDDGAMLINAWKYTMADDDQDDPDEDGEHWYYFNNKGKKVNSDTKKINGKTYLFDQDGKMLYGWQYDGDDGYYYGDENDGARTESKWLWLEKSGLIDEDEDDQEKVLGCDEDDKCDDEGWYWFQSSGKIYHGADKKKINGRYYLFNDHGQMLYEWINGNTSKKGSNAQLDGEATKASIGEMRYYNAVEEGWRADGWYQIDGSEDVGTDGDTDWYYVDDGEVKHADTSKDQVSDIKDDDDAYVYVARIKVNGKYFAFNEKGQMLTGLQFVEQDGAFYYFDEDGYQKTGKISSVECDDDDYTFYFNTKNGKNGQGVTGEKDGYLYFAGKRLEADDDYRLYYVKGAVYLVNSKGKIQKSDKDYDIENVGEDVAVTFSGKTVKTVENVNISKEAIEDILEDEYFDPSGDYTVSIPFIQLYDDNIYTYGVYPLGEDGVETVILPGWN